MARLGLWIAFLRHVFGSFPRDGEKEEAAIHKHISGLRVLPSSKTNTNGATARNTNPRCCLAPSKASKEEAVCYSANSYTQFEECSIKTVDYSSMS